MKFKPITLLIVIAAIVLVALTGTITTVAIANSPSNASGRAIKGGLEDFFERDDIKPFVDLAKGGSVEVKLEGMKSGSGEDVFGDSKVAGKLYLSPEAIMLSDVEFERGDYKVAGRVYVADDKVYLEETELLDIEIGAEFSKLAKDLEKSIFAKDSGSEYALEEDIYDVVYEVLENIEALEDLDKDAEKLLDDISKDLWEIVIDNAEVSSESETVRLNGDKTKVRMITIEINDKCVRNIVEDVYDYLNKDKKIVKFIEDNEDMLLPIVNVVVGGEIDSLAEEYDDWLDETGEEIDDICDEIEFDATLAVKIATPKHSADLLMLALEFDDTELFTLDCGKKGIKKTDIITFEGFGTTVTYEVQENSKDAAEASLTVKGIFDETVLSMKVNKDKGTYTASYEEKASGGFNFTNNGYKVSVKGEISTKGDTTSLTVDKILRGDEVLLELDCEITVDTNDKMPSLPKNFDTIDDITEEDIENWASKFFATKEGPADSDEPLDRPAYNDDSQMTQNPTESSTRPIYTYDSNEAVAVLADSGFSVYTHPYEDNQTLSDLGIYNTRLWITANGYVNNEFVEVTLIYCTNSDSASASYDSARAFSDDLRNNFTGNGEEWDFIVDGAIICFGNPSAINLSPIN